MVREAQGRPWPEPRHAGRRRARNPIAALRIHDAARSIAGLRGADLVLAIGWAVAIASLVVRFLTLDQPLVESHSFRQTQTAYTALMYHREGTDLLSTPLPVFGPPWVAPMEFPLYQGIAAMVMNAGVTSEVALRATSLGFFVLSGFLVWRIVRGEVGPRAASVATIAFLIAPLGLLWSRASIIETLAVALALSSVWKGLAWDRGGSRLDLALAVALGALAAAVKITTAAIWLVPAVFLLRRSWPAAIALVMIAAATGLAWTLYADSVKAASPATEFLTSSGLRVTNFGPIEQRLDPDTWFRAFRWLFGLGFIVVLAPLVARRSRIGAWSMTTLVLGPLVFTNLYVAHDYYWMAVAPAAAILIALVVRLAWQTSSGRQRQARMVALGVVFGLSFIAYPHWMLILQPKDEAHILERAAQIRAATRPDDLVAIDEGSWSPALLYYADRRGYMVPVGEEAPPGYVVFECPTPLIGGSGPCIQKSSP